MVLFSHINKKTIKMTYLEKIDQREIDKKKVVSARVSEDVLSALNRAE